MISTRARRHASVVLIVVATVVAWRAAPAAQSAPYRILISNDDGVRAPGILALALALRPLGEITIAAPAENQSGKGHSITIGEPMYVDKVTLAAGPRGVLDHRDAGVVREGRLERAVTGEAGSRRDRDQPRLQPRTRHLRVGHGRCGARSGAEWDSGDCGVDCDRADRLRARPRRSCDRSSRWPAGTGSSRA